MSDKSVRNLTNKVDALFREQSISGQARVQKELEVFAQHATESLDIISYCMKKLEQGQDHMDRSEMSFYKIDSFENIYTPTNPVWNPDVAVAESTKKVVNLYL